MEAIVLLVIYSILESSIFKELLFVPKVAKIIHRKM
jgi:hypothetical protein